MDEYQYALMKENLERIQKIVERWQKQIMERCPDAMIADASGRSMIEIEHVLDRCGFHA